MPFLGLYAALYAAFGVVSPFLPAFLREHGLTPEAIALVLATDIGVRLLSGPVTGWIADRLTARRTVLALCAGGASLVALVYLRAQDLGPLLLVSIVRSAFLAPAPLLADALALASAAPRSEDRPRFDYGWVRGAGAGAFILGSLVAGQAMGHIGIDAAIWLHAALLAITALAAAQVPYLQRPFPVLPPAYGHLSPLLHLKLFRRILLVAALIQGSHSLHDSFAVIRWEAAGIGPEMAAVLWSESVAAEVLVFLVLARPLLDQLGPAGASALAALAGVLRWSVMAQTAWLPAMALVEPLHGLTFALQHLACMRLLAVIIPPGLSATALAIYGTVGVGAASALVTLLSGPIYSSLGYHSFWLMAALCAAALPLTRGLQFPTRANSRDH
jgi:MFS transporter, PPP family, 3-phenylpropionic acid transporter